MTFTVLDVAAALDAIASKTLVANGKIDLEFLAQHDLVHLMEKAMYEHKLKGMEYLATLRDLEKDYQRNLIEVQEKIAGLEKKRKSKIRSHLVPKAVLRGVLREEEYELGGLLRATAYLRQNMAILEEAKKTLEVVEKELASIVQVPSHYVSLAPRGQMVRRLLGVALDQEKELPFALYEARFSGLQKAIDARYARFRAFSSFVVDEKQAHCDLILSCLVGEPKWLSAQVRAIDQLLEQEFQERYNYSRVEPRRLKTIFELLSLSAGCYDGGDGCYGDSETLPSQAAKEMASRITCCRELFEVALAHEHTNSYSTLFEASLNLSLPLPTAEEKWARYEAVGKALGTRGWEWAKAPTCYTAAQLARREGSAQGIADEFRALELALVKQGRSDTFESGCAALFLMEMEGSIEEKAQKHAIVFDAMHEYGWPKMKKYYADAAVVALLPGNPKENVCWLDYITEKMKGDGFASNITTMGVAIIAQAYEQIDRRTKLLQSPWEKEWKSPFVGDFWVRYLSGMLLGI